MVFINPKTIDTAVGRVLPRFVFPVKQRQVDLGEVKGVVAGNLGEVLEATYLLIALLATRRLGTAGISLTQ